MADSRNSNKLTLNMGILVLAVILLVAAAIASVLTVIRIERNMRNKLLQEARIVTQAVDVNMLMSLAGTKADISRPAYLQIKRQLAEFRKITPNCRFIYIMGRKPDGRVFFFVDDVPVGHEDEAPAGMIYDDAPDGVIKAFETGKDLTIGPYTDQWGVFIASMIPITNPKTGRVIAVLGMDLDSKNWRWTVAANAAPPIGLILAILIGLLVVLASVSRVRASSQPVLRRLLLPLTVMLALLMLLGGGLLSKQYQARVEDRISILKKSIYSDFSAAMKFQADGLRRTMTTISADPRLSSAMQQKDSAKLLADWGPVYEKMSRKKEITHFLFTDPNRVVIMRIHDPEKRGDTINRFTAVEAQRTGGAQFGLEVDSSGELILRVVQPVYKDGVLLGYIELGKGIEDVLQGLGDRFGSQLALSIEKKYLGRKQWAANMQSQGRETNWDRLPNDAIIYSSQEYLPDVFAEHADSGNETMHGHDNDIAYSRKLWRVSTTIIKDASGKDVGCFLTMTDVTSERADFRQMLLIGGVCGGVLLIMLLAFVYVMLRRTDKGIITQQASLRKSEEKLSATLRSIGDGVISCDVDGNVVNLNGVAARLTGWTSQEAQGHSIDEVFNIVNSKTRQKAENPVERAIREGVIVELANHIALISKDGTESQIADSCSPIRDSENSIIGAVLVFRDVTNEYHQREALRESEARLRAITDSAQDAIIMMDSEGRISFWNPAAEKILGYSRDEAIGQNLHGLLSPKRFLAAHNAAFPEFLRTGRGNAVGKTLELAAVHKDGDELSVSLSLSAVNIKGQWHAVGILRDITEQKKAEDVLLNARKKELETGVEIQHQLLLGEIPDKLLGANIAAFSIPSQFVDGDFYDFIKYDNRHFDLFIGDVMGKGISAALCGAATKAQMLKAIYNLVCSNMLATLPTLEEIVSYVHAIMCDKLVNIESFVTACLARFDMTKNRMDFVDCGHSAIVHFRKELNTCDLIKGMNFPIGFSPDEVYEQHSVHFIPGDIFCFYSDGIIEAKNPQGELFGIKRMTDFIVANSHLTSEELSDALARELEKYSDNKFSDDVTLICVKIGDIPSDWPLYRREANFTSVPDSVAEIHTFVKSTLLETTSGAAEVILKLELAASETVANIIKHAYNNQSDKPIFVNVDVFADKVEITLRHYGTQMEKRQFATPAFDGSHDNGYGLYMVRNCVDEIELLTGENGLNSIKLLKKFPEGMAAKPEIKE